MTITTHEIKFSMLTCEIKKNLTLIGTKTLYIFNSEKGYIIYLYIEK